MHADQIANLESLQTSHQRISFKRRLTYSFLIYLAFILILVAVEIVTRLTLPHIPSLDLFINTPQQKAQISSAQQSAIFEGDPHLLWRLKPNLDHVVWDFTIFSTNGQSFRANYPIQKKAPGVFRIVCLGDSVTFGYRVPPVWPHNPAEYNPEYLPYPMLLEKQLRASNPERTIEVIAMAVPGYTSHQGLAWLRRELETLQPDLLTVSFGWNDVSMSDISDRDAIRSNWTAFAVRWMVDHSQAFAHATSWLRSEKHQSSSTVRKPISRISEEEYLANMLEITRIVRARGMKVVMVAAPYRDKNTNPSEAQLMIRYRSSLRQLARNNDIPYLEILELTEAAYPANLRWFGELIHPNHMGHRLIASELLKLFARSDLLIGLSVPELVP